MIDNRKVTFGGRHLAKMKCPIVEINLLHSPVMNPVKEYIFDKYRPLKSATNLITTKNLFAFANFSMINYNL